MYIYIYIKRERERERHVICLFSYHEICRSPKEGCEEALRPVFKSSIWKRGSRPWEI